MQPLICREPGTLASFPYNHGLNLAQIIYRYPLRKMQNSSLAPLGDHSHPVCKSSLTSITRQSKPVPPMTKETNKQDGPFLPSADNKLRLYLSSTRARSSSISKSETGGIQRERDMKTVLRAVQVTWEIFLVLRT